MAWQFQFETFVKYEKNISWKNFTPKANEQVNDAISDIQTRRRQKMRTSDDVAGPCVSFKHTYTNPKGNNEWTLYTLDLQQMVQWQTRDSVKSSRNIRKVNAFWTSDRRIKFEWVRENFCSEQYTPEQQTTPRLFPSWMPDATETPPAKAPPPILKFHQALGDTQAMGFQVEDDHATGSEDSWQTSDFVFVKDTIPETISDTISETPLQTDTIPEPLRTSGAYTRMADGKWVRTVKQHDNNDVGTTVDQVLVMGPSGNINVSGRSPQPGSQPRAYYTGLAYLPMWHTNVPWSNSFPSHCNGCNWAWNGCNWASVEWLAGGEDDVTDDSGAQTAWSWSTVHGAEYSK